MTFPDSNDAGLGFVKGYSPVVGFMSDWFPWVIRLTALGFFVFFFVLALHSLNLIDFGDTYSSLVRWGVNAEAYELMICMIYIVWSVFLWRCAGKPYEEITFIDFTVVANMAHFGLMFFQGLFMEGEHQHLHGDILLAWAGLFPLIVFWFFLRPSASRTNAGHGDRTLVYGRQQQ